MKHLEISAQAVGDAVTAISECHMVVKAWGKDMFLCFPEGFSITVKPNSDVQDLITIWRLERKLKIRTNETNP